MTAAQKTAKAKFKQAIAYRQKTGVTLKEAFAHIYGKKVGVVKKKAAPKKKVGVINKKYTVSQLKKIANNAAYATGGDLDKMTYRLLDKDYTDKLLPMYLKAIKEHEEKYNTKLGSTKLKPKKTAKKKIGYSKVRLEQEKGITKVLKNTPRTLFPYTAKEKIVKAGKKYFDEQAKKISGLYKIIGKVYNKYYIEYIHPNEYKSREYFNVLPKNYYKGKDRILYISKLTNKGTALIPLKYTKTDKLIKK
jgi:hypothetical protein